jgi:hypothetical protein
MADQSTPTLDAHILDLMEPEERAALLESDPADIEALRRVAGTQNDPAEADDDGDDGAAEDAPPVDGAAAAAEPAAAPAAAPAQAAEAPAPAAAPQTAPPPAYQFDLPADHAERTEANKVAQLALYDRYKDGEMSVEELQAEQRKLDDERDDLRSLQVRADVAADMQRQSADAVRQAAVNSLFERTASVIDYRKDEAAMQQLDRAVKLLAADQANENQPLQWFLDEGHRMVAALRGVASAPAAGSAAAPAPAAAIAAAAAARKPDVAAAAAASVAHVPGGGGPGDVGSEFDDIMSLDGEAFEDAIAAMARSNPSRFARFQSERQ